MSTADRPLDEVLARFFQRTAAGIRPGLEVEMALLEHLGHPERSYLTIHVAGTNGKGSVCAMIESVLRAAGIRTGLYTSPHLVRFHERVRVDGACISDGDLAKLLTELEEIDSTIADKPGLRKGTFFELGTALAFEHFRRKGVHVAVLETGMGGAWDATNVTIPLVSVITRIDRDHMNYLGESMAGIASEKSGIIRQGRPVVYGSMPDEARDIVLSKARALNAKPVRVEDVVSMQRKDQGLDGQTVVADTTAGRYGPLRLPLLGKHQMENASLAIAALEVVAAELDMSMDPDIVREGMESLCWPGRCQVLSWEPLVLLDGAHNPCGARSLASVLRELARDRRIALVAGFLSDKDHAGFMRIMAGSIKRCWAVPVASSRGLPAQDAAASMRQAGVQCVDVADSVQAGLAEAEAWAAEVGGVVCATGSLYLVGEILAMRGPPDLFA